MTSAPITVGELSDVPAPESPINAQYMQEVAHRIVHRFATVAAMNAWAAANGSLAFVAATNLHYRRVGGVWAALLTGDTQWIGYTPTAAPSAAPLLSAGGRYMRVGADCRVEITLNMSTEAGVGSPLAVACTLPFATVGTSLLGQAWVVYGDAVVFAAGQVVFSNNKVILFPTIGATGQITTGGFTNAFPRAASGGAAISSVTISGSYQIG